MKKRKIISIIVVSVLLIFTSECTAIKKIEKSFWQDHNNPCTPGKFQNNTECEYWKNTYPKEYKAYQKRLKKLN